MPRYARKRSDTLIYHIMLRGNNREKIFIDDEDKLKIIGTLERKKRNNEYNLYAYCVMDNHIHLVVKEGEEQIGSIIKRVAGSYSNYFNKKYQRIGHVFQERYKSEPIEDESYLLSCIRYIHQNPFKSNISTIERYQWSSYKDYIRQDNTIIDAGDILAIISSSKEKALAHFTKINQEATNEVFIDLEEEKEISEINVAEFINSYLTQSNIKKEDLKNRMNKSKREELVRLLLVKSNFSLRGIADITGLNREIVRKINMSSDLSP